MIWKEYERTQSWCEIRIIHLPEETQENHNNPIYGQGMNSKHLKYGGVNFKGA